MKAVWNEDPVTFPTRWIPAVVNQMRMQPQPCAPIPIWIGGSSDAAIARALRLDGWHGSHVAPEQAPAMVQRLRAGRPDTGFTVAVRTPFDGGDTAVLRGRLDAYKAAGIQHVLVAPEERGIEEYLAAVERVARSAEGL
jgi:alkanesulfonate monooxygenase SsuD/methylene tetrahydromethanopterin reductase-like flavin-dependent oxidoreductase (luciferase family)